MSKIEWRRPNEWHQGWVSSCEVCTVTKFEGWGDWWPKVVRARGKGVRWTAAIWANEYQEVPVAAESFRRVADAKAWCEQQLAEHDGNKPSIQQERDR